MTLEERMEDALKNEEWLGKIWKRKERNRERADNANQPERAFLIPAFKKLQEIREKQEKIE